MNKHLIPLILSASALLTLACGDDSTRSETTTNQTCQGDDCETSCEGDNCEKPCQGDNCEKTCEGDNCEKPCEGDNCEKPCQGDNCEKPCEGDNCEKPCEGDNCENPCEGDNCEKPCEGNNCEKPCQGDNCEKPCEGDNCEKPCEGDECQKPSDECNQCEADQKKCDGTKLMVCKPNDQNCLDWAIEDECESGSYCDTEALACVTCQETCPQESKKCESNGVAECSPDANGCAVWTTTTICHDSEHCDPESLSCVPGCTDQCQEGQQKCDGNKIQSCSKSDDGCTIWETTQTCDFGKYCDDKSFTCQYLCGNDDECKPFSLIILPDSQYYTLNHNDSGNSGSGTNAGIYKKQTQWIVDHQKSDNIRFVLHMGDVVNDNKRFQYKLATEAHKTLSDAGIPYSIATGNHEYKKGDSSISYAARSRTLFGEYFNDKYIKDSFKETGWFQKFVSTGSMYATFNVGKLKFAVLALEYAPRKDILCWADELIQTKFKDHYVIITTHAYLSSNGRGNTNGEEKFSYFNGKTIIRGNKDNSNWGSYTPFGASGSDLYRELAARHSNVILIASGHHCDIAHRDREGYNGNNIHETLVDYQCERPCLSLNITKCCDDNDILDNGNGWMRQLIIDPKNIQKDGKLQPNVQAKTISALKEYQDQALFYCDSTYHKNLSGSDHTYSFTIDFSKPIEYKYTTKDNLEFGVRDINAKGDGNQLLPAVAVNRTTGAFVAVWEDDSSSDDGTDNHDIEGRIFCPGGCQDTNQFTVNTTTKGQQRNPDVAMDKDGNFVVVWEDDYESDGTYQIYMRGFDAKGKERFATKTVNSDDAGQQYTPSIAMAPNGNFVVAWEDQSVNAKTPQIYIRGFKADGTELFHDRNTMDSVSGSRIAPDVAMDKDGKFVVTWQDDTDGNDLYQIYAKGFNADGSERIKAFTVNTNDAGQQYTPAVAMNASGDFYIVYDDNQSSSVHHINARGFDASGKEIFKDQNISDKDEIDGKPRPVVCVADDRSAVFGWKAMTTAAHDYKYGDIHRRGVTSTGELKNISTAHYVDVGNQESPALGCTASGKHVFLFSDDDDRNDYTEIFGRGYNSID